MTEHRTPHLPTSARVALLAGATNACITERRLRACATGGVLIVDGRVQCSMNPAGPDRPHEFTARCEGCGNLKCPHCDCHEL